MDKFLIIAGICAVLSAILVPTRFRYLINDIFNFLLTPVRVIQRYSGTFWQNLTRWCKKILSLSNIKKNHMMQALACVFFTAVAFISVLADLEIVVLTLQALGVAGESLELDYFVDLASAMAISMMGGLTLFGIIALDSFHITKWLPLPFEESEWSSKTMAVISIFIIVGGIVTLGYMAKYRAEALSKPVELSELVDKQRIDTSSSVQSIEGETKTTVALLFTFISVVSLLTAIAGLACFPAALSALIVAAF